MTRDRKITLIMSTIIAAIIIGIAINVIVSSQQSDAEQMQRMKSIGNLRFAGDVTDSKVYTYDGKQYYQACVKLVYTNTKSIEVYNSLCCVKIKNGVATMPAGPINPAYGIATYIQVNLKSNHKVIYHYKAGQVEEKPFTLTTDGLLKSDLNTCN